MTEILATAAIVFPAAIIVHAVRLYFRLSLSLRMGEDMLAARGIIVSHQTIQLWAEKFGRTFAHKIVAGHPAVW